MLGVSDADAVGDVRLAWDVELGRDSVDLEIAAG
jgi:hypothetical protein